MWAISRIYDMKFRLVKNIRTKQYKSEPNTNR